MESSRIRLAADVGGTFTDVAAFDETTGELRLGKTLTTPARLVTGVEKGVTKAGARFSGARLFLHGTTVAITPFWSGRGRLARSSPPKASATSTRSAASIGRNPTISSFAATSR
jgi:N-methylhydantoinase A/oxoprolinase/acetone carboxylase beta subunit